MSVAAQRAGAREGAGVRFQAACSPRCRCISLAPRFSLECASSKRCDALRPSPGGAVGGERAGDRGSGPRLPLTHRLCGHRPRLRLQFSYLFHKTRVSDLRGSLKTLMDGAGTIVEDTLRSFKETDGC